MAIAFRIPVHICDLRQATSYIGQHKHACYVHENRNVTAMFQVIPNTDRRKGGLDSAHQRLLCVVSFQN
jgi:hypothetical protein